MTVLIFIIPQRRAATGRKSGGIHIGDAEKPKNHGGTWYGSGLAPEPFPWGAGMAGAERYEDEMLEEGLCSCR